LRASDFVTLNRMEDSRKRESFHCCWGGRGKERKRRCSIYSYVQRDSCMTKQEKLEGFDKASWNLNDCHLFEVAEKVG
jgi:hypothetical protein